MLTCSKENACDIDLKIFNFYLIEKKKIFNFHRPDKQEMYDFKKKLMKPFT